MQEVSCSWRLAPDADCGASEDAAVSSALALRDDCAQHGAQWEPPLSASLRLEQAAAGGPCELSVVLPRSAALRRVVVCSSARTLELLTRGPGSAWEYVTSARGEEADSDGSFRVELALDEPGCVCEALKLRLLSLRPPGSLALRGVLLEVAPAPLASPAQPMAALASALQGGGGGASSVLMLGLMGALAGGARTANAQQQPPAELMQALRSVAAAPEVAATAARVQALEALAGSALGEEAAAALSAEPPSAELASLELRVTRLEARMERGLADLSARLLQLEQAGKP